MMEGNSLPNLNLLLGWLEEYPSSSNTERMIYKITHRQVIAWREYYKLSMNFPDRSDYYQMMHACQTVRVNSKHPGSVQPQQFKLSFGDTGIKQTREERNRIAKATMEERIASRGGMARFTIMNWDGKIVREALIKPNQGIGGNPRIRPPSKEDIRAFQERRRGKTNASIPDRLNSPPPSRLGRNAADTGVKRIINSFAPQSPIPLNPIDKDTKG